MIRCFVCGVNIESSKCLKFEVEKRVLCFCNYSCYDIFSNSSLYWQQVQAKGFVLIPNVFQYEVSSTDLRRRRHLFVNIFKYADIKVKRRAHRPVTSKDGVLHSIVDAVGSFLKRYFPMHDVTAPHLLRSLPNCEVQPAHCDYLPNEILEVPEFQLPLGCLISIQENTTLTVWSNALAVDFLRESSVTKAKFSKTIIEVPKGSILLFRADQIHAGSAYKEENYRLHFYLDTNKSLHPHGSTWRIDQQSEYIQEMFTH